MAKFFALKGFSSINHTSGLQRMAVNFLRKRHESDKLNNLSQTSQSSKLEARQNEQSLINYKLIEQSISRKMGENELDISKLERTLKLKL